MVTDETMHGAKSVTVS